MRIAMTARQYDKKGSISRYVVEYATTRGCHGEALKYSWDAIAARTLEVYEEVLRG